MSKKFGLDFGTTNSSIAIADGKSGKVLEVDLHAPDPRVVRSMLYFNRREIKYSPHVNQAKIMKNVFEPGDYYWEGEFHPLVGHAAIAKYLEENRHRHAGITRRVYTGRMVRQFDSGEGPKTDLVQEYYEEVDYGVGRLMQALKTALKSPYYKGTSVFGQYFTLEELIGTFLQELKKIADDFVGEEVNAVVCGRPVHFLNNAEKDAEVQKRLEQGLRSAGFTEVEFEFEPVAAAKQFIAQEDPLSLSLSREGRGSVNVFVFDFGGGTLDTAIVKVDDADSRTSSLSLRSETSESNDLLGNDGTLVLAVDGVYIGGDLLNADIMRSKLWEFFGSKAIWGDYNLPMPTGIFDSLQSWFSIPNLNNPQTLEQFNRLRYKNSDLEALDRLVYLIKANLGFNLYESIERAKKHLSFYDSSRIVFKQGIIDIDVEITKLEFEQIIQPRVEEIRETVKRTLKTAELEAEQIDVVVRTGGSSLIPVFENMLVDLFGKEKIRQFETFTSIAGGLALT